MHRRSPTPTRFAANRIRSVRRFHVKCIWDSPRCCNARAQFGDISANVKSVAKSPTYVIRHVHKSDPKRTLGDVMKRTNVVSVALIAALAVSSNRPAHAAEITILVNQGATPGVRELAAAFSRASGHKVTVIQADDAVLQQRLNDGTADLITGK